MRRTPQAWWCVNGHRNIPYDKECRTCHHVKFERHALVHASERAAVYINPATGERRTPPRVDMAMPEVYAEQGFERHEILSMVEWEKQTGLVHEPTNFNPGNEPNPGKDPYVYKPDPKVMHDLAKDLSEVLATDPTWTGSLV